MHRLTVVAERRRADEVRGPRGDIDEDAVVLEVGNERLRVGATVYRYRLEKNGVGGVADVKDLDALEARNVLRHVLAVTRVGRLGLIDRAEEEMLPDRDVSLSSVASELDHQLGVSMLRNVHDAEANHVPRFKFDQDVDVAVRLEITPQHRAI